MPTSKRKHILSDYVRVDDKFPCPKCGKPDYCLVHHSGRKCICARIESGKRRGKAGWLHYVANGRPMPDRQKVEHEYLTTRQVQDYLESVTHARNYTMIQKQAVSLGLSAESFLMMQATYDQDRAVLVGPMVNERRTPIGCRFRRADGKKYSLKGGREGVFLSRNFSPLKPIVVVEGFTDSAASVEIGFENVIGRPNCSGGGDIIKRLIGTNRRVPILFISDPDECGTSGAVALAREMVNPVVVVAGPCDLREFTTKRLPKDCRRAILDGVNGDEVDVWQPVFRNLAGQFFDFVGALTRHSNVG